MGQPGTQSVTVCLGLRALLVHHGFLQYRVFIVNAANNPQDDARRTQTKMCPAGIMRFAADSSFFTAAIFKIS